MYPSEELCHARRRHDLHAGHQSCALRVHFQYTTLPMWLCTPRHKTHLFTFFVKIPNHVAKMQSANTAALYHMILVMYGNIATNILFAVMLLKKQRPLEVITTWEERALKIAVS